MRKVYSEKVGYVIMIADRRYRMNERKGIEEKAEEDGEDHRGSP